MLQKFLQTGSQPLKAGQRYQSAFAMTIPRQYPQAETLKLPQNIDPNESSRFSPQRSRELNSSSMLTHHFNFLGPNKMDKLDITLDNSSAQGDPHIASYDCHNAVSLNSSMQSNVPQPFGGLHNYAIARAMPGGGWSCVDKYQAGYLQSSHYTNLRQEFRKNWNKYEIRSVGGIPGMMMMDLGKVMQPNVRYYSSQQKPVDTDDEKNKISNTKSKDTQESENQKNKTLSKTDQLKKAIKDYGSTVIIFHIGISLISLGGFYLLVSSGLDIALLLDKMGVSAEASSKLLQQSSTFVIAYAVHKIFAPVRISITLFSTPFIVRYLRSKGILKPPKKF